VVKDMDEFYWAILFAFGFPGSLLGFTILALWILDKIKGKQRGSKIDRERNVEKQG